MLVIDDYIHIDCIWKSNNHKARLFLILPTSLHPCHLIYPLVQATTIDLRWCNSLSVVSRLSLLLLYS